MPSLLIKDVPQEIHAWLKREAERNRRSRAALAQAEDPAQMLAYPEVFTLEEAEQDGRVVVLTGTVEPASYPMSSLARGPVLLATC